VGVVGGKCFKSKRNRVWGGEKIKFHKKKNRDQGKKKHWEGGREKIKLQRKTEIRAEEKG
jgi:hypothetical protein